MSQTTTITVTGATGNIGSRLVALLATEGVEVRAVGRSADRLAAASELGAEAWVGDQGDADFLGRAFTGVDAAFFLIPPGDAEPDFRAYQRRLVAAGVTAIERSGLRRVVSLSSVGAHLPAGTGPITGLHLMEEALNAVSGLHVSHLRPSYFMENHLMSLGLIQSQGINGSPIKADLPMAMVATADIASAAARLLAEPRFEGRSEHYLLGDRDYTMREATQILGAAIGRPDLPYVEFPFEAAREAMRGMGLSASLVDDYLEMNHAFNDGLVRPTEPRTAANTTPTSLATFAREVFAPAFAH